MELLLSSGLCLFTDIHSLIQSAWTGLLPLWSHCSAWYKYQTASLQFVIALQQFIMATRGETILSTVHSVSHIGLRIVYALYQGSRKIAIILATSLFIEHALIVTFTGLTFSHIMYDDICIATQVSSASMGIGFVGLGLLVNHG
jgi:hypothetical protein